LLQSRALGAEGSSPGPSPSRPGPNGATAERPAARGLSTGARPCHREPSDAPMSRHAFNLFMAALLVVSIVPVLIEK
jgi:hypothetical protein